MVHAMNPEQGLASAGKWLTVYYCINSARSLLLHIRHDQRR